ncbi:MAG: zeta toxin family protein [Verrucomicrobia bacterium]|nr:zeta toxin family protein [Verrucomicrobiota bacterium]
MNQEQTVIIIAGPNGAGKTTFAREFLPQEANCHRFINADLIALGLSPFRPEEAALRAARLMLGMIAECVSRGESFAIETTLSGRTYAQMIPQWKQAGYQVTLFFLHLPSEELAVARVADRVAQGGHHVPEHVIRRHFRAGLANFHARYKSLADVWRLYDNSGARPILINCNDAP